MSDRYWIYMIECDNGAFYTGYTRNVALRYRLHVDGTANAKYTRSFRPVRLAQCWRLECDVGTALRIERLIKRSGRRAKVAFVDDGGALGVWLTKRLDDPVTVVPFDPARAEEASRTLTPEDIREGIDPLESLAAP